MHAGYMFLKSVSDKRLLVVFVLIVVFCAKIPPEKAWNNPFDPHGTNYHPPKVFSKTDTVLVINDTVILVAEGSDENGTIAAYCWSFDNGSTWDTVSNSSYKTWVASETGAKTVLFRAIDNDGLASSIDSFKIMVHSYAPVLTPVSDMTAGQREIVSVSFQASDTVGNLIRYYIKTGNSSGWSDSSDSPQFAISNPEGGPLKVFWAVMDDDYNVVTDSFTIFFNRGPDTAAINPAGAFQAFDYNECLGSLPLSFYGTDPDGDTDTLHYTLFIGTGTGTLSEVYSGRETEFVASGLPPSTSCDWKLRVKDLFGDSIEVSGSFVTPDFPGGPSGMKFVRSKGASFNMGQDEFADHEKPVHSVSFSYHFWIDSTEVTSENFAALVGTSPSENGSIPITGISWFDAAYYCNARSKRDALDTVYIYTSISGTVGENCVMEGLSINMDAGGYRLPTEAEWEYACRSGKTSLFYWGNNPLIAADYAWIKSNSSNTAHPVAQKKPNSFRLYDMAGNVWEWCNDWFDAAYYSVSPSADPAGPDSGLERVIRGGSWMHSDYFAQSGTRSKMTPANGNATIGFRVVLQVR